MFHQSFRHSCCWVIDIAVLGKSFADMQAAPEEDLKHVFDVLDKSGEGMITADSLRSAIKVCTAGALACVFAPVISQHAYDIQCLHARRFHRAAAVLSYINHLLAEVKHMPNAEHC